MKIIITESQYNLIIEREDQKNFSELVGIYRMFQTKLKNREFSQRTIMGLKGFDLALNMTLNTDFGDLKIELTEQRNGVFGQYRWINEYTTPKIVLFNCKFKLGDEKHVNDRGIKTSMQQIVGIAALNAQAFKHEMVHFIDDKKKRKLNQKPDMSQKEWHNDSFEMNAEFLSVVNQIKNKKDYVLPDTFNEFLDMYKNFNLVTHSQWEHLTDNRKKSLVGRLYQYYTYMKDKLESPST